MVLGDFFSGLAKVQCRSGSILASATMRKPSVSVPGAVCLLFLDAQAGVSGLIGAVLIRQLEGLGVVAPCATAVASPRVAGRPRGTDRVTAWSRTNG